MPPVDIGTSVRETPEVVLGPRPHHSRSPESLETMMSVIVRGAGLFGLMILEPKTGNHVHAAERDGGTPVHGQRRRPDVQVDRSVCVLRTYHLRGQAGRPGDREPQLPSVEVLPPE